MDLKLKDNNQLKLAPFTQLEYIESTGTQYINTGIKAAVTDNFYIEYQFTTTGSDERSCFGVHGNGVANMIMRSGWWWGGTSRYNYTQGMDRHILSKENTIWTLDSVVLQYNVNSGNIANNSWYLFTAPSGTNYTSLASAVRIYNFKLYRGGTLLIDFIPVIDDSRNVVCFYDNVSEQFFYNQGAGNFVAGPIVKLSLPENICLKTTTFYHENTPNIAGMSLLNSVLSAQEEAEDVVLNRIRVDIGNVSGSITELLQYTFLKGFNDNYESQDKPRLVGTWTINNWYTQAQLSQAQSAFDGLTIVADPAYLIDFDQLAVQTLDSTKPGYNPGFAIKLHNKGYGVCLDNAPVPGQKGRYFLTKSQAGNINASDIGSTSKTLSDSNLIVSDTVASYTVSTLKELQYFSITNWSSALFTAWSWPSIIWVPESITNFGFYCLQYSNDIVLRCLKTTPPAIDDWYSYMANGLKHLCVGLGLDEYQDAGIVEAYQNFNATSSARYNYSNKKLKSWFEYAAPKVSYDGTDVTMTVERTSDIYYTTDGSLPTKSSTKYTAPFTWNGVGVIKAVGVETLNNSEDYVYRDFYAQTTADPVIAISGSTIEITAEQDATIYYTVDGSYPNLQSTVYTGPLSYVDNIANKIRCFAQVQGSKNASGVTELNVADILALQTVNPQGEKYNPAVSIKMEQAGKGNYVDDNDKTKGWYLTKDDAVLITSAQIPVFQNVVNVVDINGICGIVGTSYPFEEFDEFDYFHGVGSIAANKFKGCTSLVSVTVPSSVTWVGTSAFEGCTSLTQAVLNGGVTQSETGGDGANLFKGCTSLKKIYYNQVSSQRSNNSFQNIGSPSLQVIVGEGVTFLCNALFSGCTNLTSISIPNTVTSIGQGAFSSCSSLSSIQLPSNLGRINYRAFSGCSALTSIVVPSSVVYIGTEAFLNCTSLEEVTLNGGVTSSETGSDGSNLFKGCTSLKKIYYNQVTSPRSNNSFQNIGSPSLQVIVGEGVTILCNLLFNGCTNLTSISIPNTVTQIGTSAFNGCSSLLSITVPSSVTYLGTSAFSGCSSLLSITVPSSVTYLGTSAFEGCSSLEEAVLNGGVTQSEIGSDGVNLFKGCTSLKKIYYNQVNSPRANKPSGGCMFSNIGSNVEFIVGASVTVLVGNLLHGCPDIITVISNPVTPPSASAAFDSSVAFTHIYVPSASVAAYQAASGWSQFASIIEAIPTT